jgi:molybdate transport system ATP-binding protein
VIKAIVGHHDDEFDLSYLDFPGGRFAVARNHLPLSQTVRLQIKAVDVSITLEHQSNTSILNIFAASVDKIAAEGKAKVTVRLMLGSIPILARITRKSALDLCLEPGKPVYVQVKSVALLC